MTKKIYVIDTSVFLADFRAIFAYKNGDIIIPLTVLEEIDHNKKRQDPAGANARATCRFLGQLLKKGNLKDGVKFRKGGGILSAREMDASLLPAAFPASLPDNQIISVALRAIQENPESKVILVSCDINMRIKGNSLKINVEDYAPNSIVKSRSDLYTGFEEVVVDEQIIDKFYKDEIIMPGDFLTKKTKLHSNEFIMLMSNSDPKKTALARFISDNKPIKKIRKYKDDLFGFEAKNKEQQFAMDLLLDPEVQVVSLIGRAGSGKTLTALAAGLMQVMDTDKKEPLYSRIIVSRPVQPMGKDLGYLPGTLEEKMIPWLQPILDNLRFLFGNDKSQLEDYIKRGIIELEALTYIRGRSIPNAFIIIDESQNLTKHEIKTILTRAGHNTKIVLTGDIEQIDNNHVDEKSNGLVHVIEKSKDEELVGHVHLIKGERSKIATLYSNIL